MSLAMTYYLPLNNEEVMSDIEAASMFAYLEARRYMNPRKGVKLEGIFGNFLKTEFKLLYSKYNDRKDSDEGLDSIESDAGSYDFMQDATILTNGLLGKVSPETINLIDTLSAKILPNGKTKRQFICDFLGYRVSQLKSKVKNAAKEISNANIDRFKAVCSNGSPTIYIVWAASEEKAKEILKNYGKLLRIQKIKTGGFGGIVSEKEN